MDTYTHYTQLNWPEALLAKLDNCYSPSWPNSFLLLNNGVQNVDRAIVCDFGILALANLWLKQHGERDTSSVL